MGGVVLPRIVGILLIVLFVYGYAEQHTDIFQVREPVAKRSQHETQASIQDAFLQVLVRTSGDKRIAQQPAIQAALSHVEQYVSQYSFTDSAGHGLTYLEVRFDPDAIKSLLVSTHLPFWGANRPDILCWIVVDQADRMMTLSAQANTAFQQQFFTQAALMGLPVVFPLMDLTDTNLITPDRIKTDDVVALDQASKRYDAKVIISATLTSVAPGQYDSLWHLHFADQVYSWSESQLSESQTATEATNAIFQWLVMHFGDSDGKTHQLNIDVNGVTSDHALTDLINYLHRLEGVDQLMLTAVFGTQAQFALTTHMSEGVFINALGVSPHMILLGTGEDTIDYNFQWQARQGQHSPA